MGTPPLPKYSREGGLSHLLNGQNMRGERVENRCPCGQFSGSQVPGAEQVLELTG